jgi:hypothetical protein
MATAYIWVCTICQRPATLAPYDLPLGEAKAGGTHLIECINTPTCRDTKRALCIALPKDYLN